MRLATGKGANRDHDLGRGSVLQEISSNSCADRREKLIAIVIHTNQKNLKFRNRACISP